MGKSNKKANMEVAASLSSVPAKNGKKGKREAEVEPKAQPVAKKLKSLNKVPLKKKQETSSSGESESEEEEPMPKVTHSNKKLTGLGSQKNAALATIAPTKEESSSEESDSSESEEDIAQKKPVAKPITKLAPKQESSSSEEDSSEESDEEPAPKKLKAEVSVPKVTQQNKILPGTTMSKNVPVKAPQKVESSSEESESEDSEDEIVAKKKLPVKSPVQKEESSTDESDTEESDDEEITEKKPVSKSPVKVAPAKPATKQESSSSEDESSEDDEPVPPKTNAKGVKAVVKKVSSSSEEESSEDEKPAARQPKAKGTAVKATSIQESSSEEETSEESDEDSVPAKPKPQLAKSAPSRTVEKDESSSSEEESSESEEEDTPQKVGNKQHPSKMAKEDSSEEESSESDEEMEDAVKTPAVQKDKSFTQKTQNTPKTPETPGSKTLFMGNLSFSVDEDSIHKFFKDAGEVVNVRLAMNDDESLKGFGHVDFATVEAASKAMGKNGQDLCGRSVKLDFARERGAARQDGSYSNGQGRGSGFLGNQHGQKPTAFVKGIDKYQDEDKVRSNLSEYFENCGEVVEIRIPTDRDTGSIKGFAYVEFKDKASLSKAVELSGNKYIIDEAMERGAGGGGRSGGGRSGGRFSDGGGRRGGRFSDGGGRSGGRFSDGRGRGRGRGRGDYSSGRGTSRIDFASGGTGKKTTFGDD